MRVGEPVPPALAGALVLDAAGRASPLGERWAGRACLVVFLRHFGCSACSEHVTALAPRLGELARLGVSTVFVGNGAPSFMAGFIERLGLDRLPVELVTDPTLKAFAAAGLVRSAWSVAGPRALALKLRGLAAGHVQERVEGDLKQQGGVLVVDRAGRVAYVWRDRSVGDHAPMGDVVDAALRVTVQGAVLA